MAQIRTVPRSVWRSLAMRFPSGQEAGQAPCQVSGVRGTSLALLSPMSPAAVSRPTAEPLDPAVAGFYRDAVAALQKAGVPFLVGGAYAYARYTGVVRHTKDFD